MTRVIRRACQFPRAAWVVGVLAAGAVLIVASAAPASAHGSTPDGTNYRSRVTQILAVDGGTPRRLDAVTWRVLGGDGLVQVATSDTTEVIVEGYEGEPFLRVGPEGVFENRNSPATYLNKDRYADATVPADVDPAATPDWRRRSAASQWHWHDHRIHWMAPTPPPAVRDRPEVALQIMAWVVPFQVGGERLEAHGVLEYIPPPAVWPWLLVAVVVLSLPLVVLGAVGASERRQRRTLVVLTIIVAVAGLAVTVGDALATPASLATNAWAIVQTAAPVAIAGALALTAWRSTPSEHQARSESSLLVAAIIVAFAAGVSRFSQLTSSQVINALPDDAVRGTVAASLTLVVPSAATALTRLGAPRGR